MHSVLEHQAAARKALLPILLSEADVISHGIDGGGGGSFAALSQHSQQGQHEGLVVRDRHRRQA